MGEFISLSEGLLVSIVSMVAVFVVLILIAYIINALKAFGDENKEEKINEPEKIVEKKEARVIPEEPNVITEELLAVITAAVAANLGANIPDINIKSIKRVPQRATTWSNMGNMKQVIGNL